VGGPVKIGAFIGEAARTSVSSLAFLMAVISLQLGIFNLLPIPALDGGHIAYFLLPEALRGSPLRPRLRARIQTVGMTLLIALMVFVTYNDIVQLLS
jgi:regulator of sigma E protease